jgi:hypothetical protein
MSKMDNLRAMREAKYADAQKRAASAPSRPSAKAPVAPQAPAAKRASEPAAAAAPADGDTEELCGHRNMSGRTCTRERGHSAKSHRYS